MDKERITEEMKIHDEWYSQVESMTMEKLPEFLRHLTEDYIHDYGTIVHALTAGAIATLWAMNKTEEGGITGFQAGCIMWEFIRKWMRLNSPLRLVDYEKMLYPQYKDRFEKIISRGVWEWIQKEAKKKLRESDRRYIHPDVKQHWEDIVAGEVPFGFKVSKD